MKGAIFFSSKYGSTAQYANWIGEATGLPVFDMIKSKEDPASYDFLILGSPIIYYRIWNDRWVKKNLEILEQKPIIFFTVSGVKAGPKLDRCIAESLPTHFIEHINHFALRGRQKPYELTWYDRNMLKVGAMFNKDPEARREELYGFDYMDQSSIAPIVKMAKEFQQNNMLVC